MSIFIRNIKQLLTLRGPKKPRIGKELSELGMIENACLYIENGKIKYIGKEKEVFEKVKGKKFFEIDANGVVLPGFIDCHTHMAFAKPRLFDFSMRIDGYDYKKIKEMGGGINRSARDIKEISKEDLISNIIYFSKKFIECGTTVCEVKSGYGLNFEGEIKILESIKEAMKKVNLELIPTFLGAHSIPDNFKNSKEYLSYLKKELIPYISKNKLSVYADIFCENGYFSKKEAIDYLNFAKNYGLIPKIHAEQLSRSGGAYAASVVGAKTADHLDFANDLDIKYLKKSKTVSVFLPTSNYFLGIKKYPDVKEFIENGNIIALATDFNPGTSPCWNMQFVISVALTQMKMKIEQAIVASTYNAAYSLDLHNRKGMIDLDMDADILVMDVKDYREIGYYFGDNLNKMTIKNGEIVYEKTSSF